MISAQATAPDGVLLILALMLPAIGLLAIFVLGLGRPERVALPVLAANLAVALIVALQVGHSGQAATYRLGGWLPPLGITLRADGLSAALIAMAALILFVVAIYARGNFPSTAGGAETRQPTVFWTLLLGLATALNTVFLAQDLFSLFVALELLTFSAVPLVCLEGSRETLRAALRYLLFALAGSVLYLIGVALLYGAYGTLDIASLHQVTRPDRATSIAIGLMITGLMAKAALFPLHLWLPPAHAGPRRQRAPCSRRWWSRRPSFSPCGSGSMSCRSRSRLLQAPCWPRLAPPASWSAACWPCGRLGSN